MKWWALSELVAIDGTKIRTQNAANKAYNKEILDKKLTRLDAHIEEYKERLSGNDQAESSKEEEDAQPQTPEQVAEA